MKRFSSPEELNDYIRVSNPGIWIVLTAILLLLAGIGVWAVFGHMDSWLSVPVWTSNGESVCYVTEEKISSIAPDMTVTVDGEEYPVRGIPAVPVAVTAEWDAYLLHVSGLSDNDWVYEVQMGKTGLSDGVSEGSILTNRVAPISFVIN